MDKKGTYRLCLGSVQRGTWCRQRGTCCREQIDVPTDFVRAVLRQELVDREVLVVENRLMYVPTLCGLSSDRYLLQTERYLL